MMIANNIAQPKKSKWKYWFFGTLLILIVIYSVAWYFASQFIHDKTVQFLARGQKNNQIISCQSVDKYGYPLRVGVSCTGFSFKQPFSGIDIQTQELKVTAPIYALKMADFSFTGPASLSLPNLLPLKANWKELNFSSEITQNTPNKISLHGEDLSVVSKEENNQDKPLFSASFIRFQANGFNNNLSAQLAFDKLQLPFTAPKTNTKIPAIEGMLRLQLKDTYDIFENKPTNLHDIKELLHGHEGSIERAEIALETGGKMTINGPFSIDNDGYLNANFDIAVGDISALALSMKQLFPSEGKNIETIVFVINSMPKNKNGEPLLKVTIRDGEVKLGYIKLGNINPL